MSTSIGINGVGKDNIRMRNYTTTGNVNAYILTTGEPVTSYVTGQRFFVTFHINNTNSVVNINIDGLGDRRIYVRGTDGPSHSYIATGSEWVIEYTGSSFLLRPVTGAFRHLPMFVGVNGVAKRITSGYVGVDGIAKVFMHPSVAIILTNTVESMVKDAPFSQTLEGDGEGRYPVWGIVEGALPPGVNLSSNGVISGTPTAEGIYEFTVRFSTNMGFVNKTFNTEVVANVAIITTSIDNMVVGVPFSQALQGIVRSGTGTWSIISGSLPNGINLNNSGVLSGTPTVFGTYTFTIQLSAGGFTASREYTVVVHDQIFIVTFDPQGGQCLESTRNVSWGQNIGPLPEAERDGYVFGGWFTAASGGLQVSEGYSISSHTTLYARWGQGSDIEFGSPTTQFNIQWDGDRTNYNNQPYTIYGRVAGGAAGTANLIFQTGISSDNMTSNITSTNRVVNLYLKVTNNGAAGNFDIGFDADSYVGGTDHVRITRLANGLQFGNILYNLTVPYIHTAWAGNYSARASNRYVDVPIGHRQGPTDRNPPNGIDNGIHSTNVDTGFTLTMNNIFINSGSYAILQATFERIRP